MSTAGSPSEARCPDSVQVVPRSPRAAAGDPAVAREDVATVVLLVASAAVFYVAPWGPIYGLALLAILVLTWWRLDLALILVPLLVPYFMAPKHLGSKEFAPSEIVLTIDLLVALLYLAVPSHRSRLAWAQLARSPFLLPGMLLLVAGGLSTIFAVDRHHALRSYQQWILEPAAFFALLVLVQRRLSNWWWMFAALVASGLAVGIIGLVQYATHQDLTAVPGTSIKHVAALYGSPDNLGLLYDRVIPVWFAIALVGRLPRPIRLVWFLAGPIFALVLYLSGSRGAWVAILLACLFVLSLTARWGRWFALICLVLAVAGALIGGSATVQALRSGHAHTAQRRIDIWQSSVHMIRTRPILGVGPDNFLHYYAPRKGLYLPCAHGLGYMLSEASPEPCISHPHDEILDFWLNTGIVGLAAAIWLQVVFWTHALDAWKRQLGATALVLGAMAAMFASLVHGLVDNSYFLIDLASIFWLLCAFISFLSASSSEVRQKAANTESYPRQ